MADLVTRARCIGCGETAEGAKADAWAARHVRTGHPTATWTVPR